ncbi:glutamine amidotransferase [Paraburkholderia sp. CNPSo 3281]|uniref:glutamine amidotransferase n=1 Tax=Paraburkholderia sp. CNPSo 3281 TaxID=2940933 RepID=UPI0020B824C2|nr:glutamine amidotransferase [Paraburkholderia sp. CNPSo 3281]MCP3714073.1 glutamine amidotransferase [Paraburkholderia sp. CNPSo 3281]
MTTLSSATAIRTVGVVRHVHFEDLGSFADVLSESGCAVRYFEAGIDSLPDEAVSAPDLLIVLGGPIGAYEEASYPWLVDTLRLLEARVRADAPTLGICLGAQLLARALGARVYAGDRKEIGWSPLTLTAEGHASPLRRLAAEQASMLHWHGDTFALPEGAALLASTESYRNQVFCYGRNVLGFQCHPEVRAREFERWLIGHAGEIAATPGVSVQQLREDTQRYGSRLEQAATAMFREWLATIRPHAER